MPFEFQADYSLPVSTVSAGLSNWDLAAPIVTNVATGNYPTPVESGGWFGDTLSFARATADSLSGIFQAGYSLVNQVEGQKLQRDASRFGLELQGKQLEANRDIALARTEAERQLAVSQAQAAVANAQAQTASSARASVAQSGGNSIPWAQLLIGAGLALVVGYLTTKRGK